MKPSLYLIQAFDRDVGTTIKFSWLGNQPVSNTLRIKNNETNEIVYEITQTTMRLEHTISASNKLINGKLYNASVRITDSNNSHSEWSDVALFYCFTTPTFTINVDAGQIIQAQTYGVNITYVQPEGELLQSYKVQVFNSNMESIYDSNIRYILDIVRIANLQDNNSYYIIATGTTINGIELSTGLIPFVADFIKSEAYFVCELQNMYDTGGIYIKSNIVSVEGYADSNVTYIDNDYADLSANKVYFDQGFSIVNDFALMIKGKNFEIGKQVACIKGNDETINIYNKYDATTSQYYFELESIYKQNVYVITYNYSPIDDDISLWIRRKNALFEMEVA